MLKIENWQICRGPARLDVKLDWQLLEGVF